jgi:hypothetical protein
MMSMGIESTKATQHTKNAEKTNLLALTFFDAMATLSFEGNLTCYVQALLKVIMVKYCAA